MSINPQYPTDEEMSAVQKELARGDTKKTEEVFHRVKEYHDQKVAEAAFQLGLAAEAAFQLGQLAKSRIDYGPALNFYLEAVQLAPQNPMYKQTLEDFKKNELGGLDWKVYVKNEK